MTVKRQSFLWAFVAHLYKTLTSHLKDITVQNKLTLSVVNLSVQDCDIEHCEVVAIHITTCKTVSEIHIDILHATNAGGFGKRGRNPFGHLSKTGDINVLTKVFGNTLKLSCKSFGLLL